MRTRRGRRARLASITPQERVAVGAIAAVAAVGALVAGAHPTPHLYGDVLFTVAFAVLVTLAASIARSWAWIVLASAAAVFAAPTYPVAAFGVEGIALVAALVDIRWRRVYGALVGAASVQLLLRLGGGPFLGSTALVAGLASLPVFLTSWTLMRRTTRRRVRRVAYVAGAFVGATVLAAGFSLVQARSSTNDAIAHVRRGLDAARAGDTKEASAELAAAASSFANAHNDAGALWTRPALLLPVLGQQVDSIDHLTAAGDETSAIAAKATTEADVDNLRLRGGRIDLTKLAATARPLADVQSALTRLQHAIAVSQSPWLVAPLAERIGRIDAEVDRAQSDADLASNVVAVAPSLLGGQDVRHYFVAFGNPAEARDLGGFAGGYGELVVDNGKLSLARVGQASDLNAGGPHVLTDPEALPERYRTYNLEHFWQNITASPDLPTVAEAVRQLWPQSGGGPLDGVLYVDPSALAAMLRLTGPVPVEGFDEPMSADNIVRLLTRDQYTNPALGADPERHDLLADAAKKVFDTMTSIDLPGPRQMADALGPAAHSGHLLLHGYHQDEQQLFTRLGIDGAMPQPDGGRDVLVVTAANRGQNKIDAYLTRSIDDHVVVDPSTGRVDATVRVTLRNDAPAEGLPRVVIGNDLGRPAGTNSVVLSVSTTLALDQASLDGAPVQPGVRHEYGVATYSTEVVLAPASTSVLELRVHSQLPTSRRYTLDVVPRPNTASDHFALSVTTSQGWRVLTPSGLTLSKDGAELEEDLVQERDIGVRFART